MRHGRRHTSVVVSGDDQDPAMGRRPIGIAVFERIPRAVHPRSLAIPQTEHRLACLVRIGFHLLRANHLGRPELLVHGRKERHARFRDQICVAGDLKVNPSDRGTAVARDKSARIQPLCTVATCLIQRHSHNRLCSGHEHAAICFRVAVGQRIVAQDRGLVRHFMRLPVILDWLHDARVRMKRAFKINRSMAKIDGYTSRNQKW